MNRNAIAHDAAAAHIMNRCYFGSWEPTNVDVLHYTLDAMYWELGVDEDTLATLWDDPSDTFDVAYEAAIGVAVRR